VRGVGENMKVLLHISFLGTAYCGYQVQPNGVSVQQKLNEAAKVLFGYDCDIVGCSRTDSGVHANEFCAAVSKKGEGSLNTSIPIEKIPRAFSYYLPEDIVVFAAEAVSDDFHPRYDVVCKEYVYKILNREARDPFCEGRVWHIPRRIDDVALEKMNKAASMLLGTHDFASYMASDSKIKDTVRTIFDIGVCLNGDIIEFHISADGFLYNMVRIIMGTLVDVAFDKFSPDDIERITEARDRKMAGTTAPAQGLYLNKVVYKEQ
jgi:tRNA pseudouridine38-40 synthase